VPYAHIHDTLAAAAGPAQTVDRLIELAIEQEGRDNISAIVVDVRTAEDH
jgi:serine/threonine protein phosphatase PrpC